MTAVAFMQNQWVRDPERVKALIARHGEPYRRRLIATALFAGCLSGRRLKAAFGDACRRIVWEESTREIAGDPRTVFPADPVHIQAVIAEIKPTVVLTFGRIAGAAVVPLWTGNLIASPHPAARQADTMERLRYASQQLAIWHPGRAETAGMFR